MRIFLQKITPISVNLKIAMRFFYVFEEQKMEFIEGRELARSLVLSLQGEVSSHFL